jgi:hypothetical protein
MDNSGSNTPNLIEFAVISLQNKWFVGKIVVSRSLALDAQHLNAIFPFS